MPKNKSDAPPLVPSEPLPEGHPLATLLAWIEDARAASEPDPNAMSLATVSPEGRPEVRVVLLKGADARGLSFYTNLGSAKAAALRAHPYAEACFWWRGLQRQVRVSGPVEPVSDAEADAYFATRPRLSQIGAWASKQSQPMRTPLDLELAVTATLARFPVGTVPRPPNWSGFHLLADTVELWEQKPFRLHVRRRLRKAADGTWTEERLFP